MSLIDICLPDTNCYTSRKTTPVIGRLILCCDQAVRVSTANSTKLHKDPKRDIHNAVLRSFMCFEGRRQRAGLLMCLVLNAEPELPVTQVSRTNIYNKQTKPVPNPQLMSFPENPLTPLTEYVIHLTSRHDFGPVLSHRYFTCPTNLEEDWKEANLEQWFAKGEQFRLKSEKWDLKCLKDKKFFRLTLRPNLALRKGYSGMRKELNERCYRGEA